MHINVNSEQHTQSIGKLLKNISTKPECVKEFGRWGLEISSEILLVRLTSSCVMSQNNKLMRVQHLPPTSLVQSQCFSSLCR